MSILTETDPIYSTPDFLRRSLSPREFARRVRVSPTTVHKWLEEGLPSGMIGARRLINVDCADGWLKKKLGLESALAREDDE